MRQHLILTLAFLLLPLTSWATAAPPPSLEASAYLLKDFNSSTVIAAENAETKLEPASLTKIMTAYITFDAVKQGRLSLTQNASVSKKAWGAEGSRMFIEPKKQVTVDELLHGLIIQSGNDAAIALAETLAGSEEQFVIMMNEQAEKIGMLNTSYENATGLPSKNHYTTASDLALLAEALIRDFPEDYDRLYKVKEYTYNNITQFNRNRLLWLDKHVDGMKTGHTNAAGYCLVSSAKRSGTRLTAVVLGTKRKAMRASESQRLLNYGFQFFESTLVYEKSQAITDMLVYKGVDKKIDATVEDNLYLALPKGDYAKVTATTTSKQPLIAPIAAGQEIGTITLTLDNEVIAEHKLVAATAVSEASFWGRLIDSIKLFFK